MNGSFLSFKFNFSLKDWFNQKFNWFIHPHLVLTHCQNLYYNIFNEIESSLDSLDHNIHSPANQTEVPCDFNSFVVIIQRAENTWIDWKKNECLCSPRSTLLHQVMVQGHWSVFVVCSAIRKCCSANAHSPMMCKTFMMVVFTVRFVFL